MATANGFPDLITIMVNLGQHIGPILGAMQTIAAVIGLYFVGHALVEIWTVSNDGNVKYLKSNQKYSYTSAVFQMFIGAIFVSMGTLDWVEVMSTTITTDYVNSKYVAHTAQTNAFAEQARLATQALMGILQIVGFTAMCKCWMTLNRIVNAQTQDGVGKALAWGVGGVLAWNFEWFASVLNNSVGFNVVNLFA